MWIQRDGPLGDKLQKSSLPPGWPALQIVQCRVGLCAAHKLHSCTEWPYPYPVKRCVNLAQIHCTDCERRQLCLCFQPISGADFLASPLALASMRVASTAPSDETRILTNFFSKFLTLFIQEKLVCLYLYTFLTEMVYFKNFILLKNSWFTMLC